MADELAPCRIQNRLCLFAGQHRLRTQRFGQLMNRIPVGEHEVTRAVAELGQITLELTDVRTDVSIASVVALERTPAQAGGIVDDADLLHRDAERVPDGSASRAMANACWRADSGRPPCFRA